MLGWCFTVVREVERTYFEAQVECGRMGGRLAEITSQEMNIMVGMIAGGGRDSFWTGYLPWGADDLDMPRPFICQTEPEDIGCVEEDNMPGYTGNASRTITGQSCLHWNVENDH